MEGVSIVKCMQCFIGAELENSTERLGTVELTEGAVLPESPHEKRWWRRPSSGAWLWASHAPLRGRERYIPANQWRARLRDGRSKECAGVTLASQAFPAALNEYLALRLVHTVSSNAVIGVKASTDCARGEVCMVKRGTWQN